MSEMVERVARALSIADGNHPGACSNDEEEIPAWKLYVKDARAAIEAMREPTAAMRHAASDVLWYEGLDEGQGYPPPREAWQAMLDEALK